MTQIRVKDARGGHDLPNVDKEEFHKQAQEQYFSNQQVRYKDCHAKGILIDKDGFLYLQIKPITARDNAGLIDTGWGSHIEAGDTILTSAMYESARELGIATTILEDHHFYPMLENHPDITSELAVTRQLAHLRNFKSERLLPDGKKWIEPCELTLFISYFDGKFRQTPKNGAGMIYYKFNKLEEEINKHPERFTADLRAIVKKYGNQLVQYSELDDFSQSPDPKAKELIQVYDINGNPLEPRPRKEVHNELIKSFHEEKETQAKHRHIRVMLMRPDGSFYLQQRSTLKKENAGLIDKPVAGHVGLGDEYGSAVIHECNDELGIAAAVLREEDFSAIVNHRPKILEHQAVLTRIVLLENYVSRNRTLKDGKPWNELCDTAVYFGVYNGPIKFKDGESTGVEVKSWEDLKRQLKEQPEKYTHDLVDLVKLFEERNIFERVS